MKKKRFFAAKCDGDYMAWVVWSYGDVELSKCDKRYAEFYGDGGMKYARAHAKILNALLENKKP